MTRRLVPAPVFVMCSVRSGSTLLRSLLDAHPDVCAPHELHVANLTVTITRDYAETAMAHEGLTARDLEHLLWDRVFHRALRRSGKRVFVDKTPQNVFLGARLRKAWPKSRFLYLHRHPAAIVASALASLPEPDEGRAIDIVMPYLDKLLALRDRFAGPVVRYESLTSDAAGTLREVCRFLEVPFDAAMLDYGAGSECAVRGIGDWGEKIRSGSVQPAAPVPESWNPRLTGYVEAFGYAG